VTFATPSLEPLESALTPEQIEATRTLAEFFGPKVRKLPVGAVETPASERKTRQFTHEDLFDFAESSFYVPETNAPIQLEPIQHVILRLFFDPEFAVSVGCPTGFQSYIYSTVKKSGKTTVAALVARWITERWGSMNEVYTVANDLDQSRGLVYDKVIKSLQLDPRYDRAKAEIPGYWDVLRRDITHLPSHSIIKALSGDYAGQAGMNPTASFWSELWGYTHEKSLRLWDEMTPVPTRPRSIRWVETYAGFEGESSLLIDQHRLATSPDRGARRLTRDDVPDWPSDAPEVHELPLYVNATARMITYWDDGENARRMPWQTSEYYQAQAASLRPEAFDRLHKNIWVSSVSTLIPPEWWDNCRARPDELQHNDLDPNVVSPDEPVIISVDASVSGDCTGAVTVTRHPKDATRTLLRLAREWRPMGGHKLNYSITLEPYLRQLITGHIHPLNQPCADHEYAPELGVCVPQPRLNVMQLCYDQYQLHDMMTRFQNEGLCWVYPFSQGQNRLVADHQLYVFIRERRILHFGTSSSDMVRTHLAAAAARMSKDENTKMRIVKKATDSKIDLAVALSMGNHECMRLNLG
jgi:phage terminase large subunit-like protein